MESKWVFKLDPYNEEARKALAYLRKCISPNYRLLVRGRGPRPQPGDERGLSLDRASWVAVYIFRKDETVGDNSLPTAEDLGIETVEAAAANAGGSLGEMIEKIREKGSV